MVGLLELLFTDVKRNPNTIISSPVLKGKSMELQIKLEKKGDTVKKNNIFFLFRATVV